VRDYRLMPRSRIVLGIFFISGAAGLVYEVVWARELVLVFGNTTQAVSAILTAFFGGMAAGSVIGGRLADRVRNRLRLYGVLEIAVAGAAVLTPLLLTAVRELYHSAFAGLQDSPPELALLRFGLSLMALGPATVLMGATLPTLTRHLSESRFAVRHQFARLYSANTFGALAGTALSGFVLIELFGLSVTLFVGAAASLAAGLAALWLAAHRPTSERAREPVEVAEPAPKASVPKLAILGVVFVSGLTSLGYQVLWTRLLSYGTGASSYVFTIILILFLSGIALGALAQAIGLGRAGNAVVLLALSQVLVAALALAGLTLVGTSTAPALARIAVILPATMVLGFGLPLAAGLTPSADRTVGADTGLLLGANTVGTVMGSFAVPFWLVPAIGSPHAVVLLAALNAATAVGLLVYVHPVAETRIRGRSATVGTASAVLVVALVAPILDPGYIADRVAAMVSDQGRLLGAREDEIASVVAGNVDGKLQLWVNGTSMTTLTVDTHLIALLPLMTRPASRTELVIAFGMGTTYRTALAAGLDVRGAELVPSVPGMFGFFYSDGPSVLRDPRGSLAITDGRNEVELTSQRFDAIVADPPPPITSAGTGVLYSIEFYRACARDLTDGGVMLQWMPYGQSVDEFRAHMRTFNAVFSHVSYLLSPAQHGVLMLGSGGRLDITDANIRRVLARPGILQDLADAPDSPPLSIDGWVRLIQGLEWTNDDEARGFAGIGDIISDDRPRTEYFILRSAFGPNSPHMGPETLRAALEAYRSSH
jgi:spermidine synthase